MYFLICVIGTPVLQHIFSTQGKFTLTRAMSGVCRTSSHLSYRAQIESSSCTQHGAVTSLCWPLVLQILFTVLQSLTVGPTRCKISLTNKVITAASYYKSHIIKPCSRLPTKGNPEFSECVVLFEQPFPMAVKACTLRVLHIRNSCHQVIR